MIFTYWFIYLQSVQLNYQLWGKSWVCFSGVYVKDILQIKKKKKKTDHSF